MPDCTEDARIKNRLLELYDLYRDSMLNQKYYGIRLHQITRLNLFVEISIAVTATSSGIAGWKLWEQDAYREIWAVIAGATTILAVMRPILSLSKIAERYERLFAGYQRLFLSLKALAAKVQDQQTMTLDDLRELRELRAQIAELTEKDDPRPSPRLLSRLRSEVNETIPPHSLWLPCE
jgi:hypothetical protein